MSGPTFDLGQWLRSVGPGLEIYAQNFAANDITPEVLPHLTTEDLRDMGVQSIGHRRLILAAVAATRQGQPEAAPGDERRILTVVFCDLVASTQLASQADPEDFVDFIGRFRAAMEAAISAFGGSVVQYLGDGIMACFGYPTASEHDAERAVAAGFAAIEAVANLGPLAGHVPQVRVGIATGLAIIGGSSGGALNDLSAVGETPNLAARLQTVAPPGGVVISDQTRSLIGALFDCADLGRHPLKGFDAAVPVWQVTGVAATTSRFEALRRRGGYAPFVGRHEERQNLEAQLARVPAMALLVSGDAGIGKSRLLHETLSGVGLPNPMILQCSPYNAGVPLHPLRYLLLNESGYSRSRSPAAAMARIEAILSGQGIEDATDIALVADFLDLPPLTLGTGLTSLSSDERRARLVRVLEAVVLGLARAGGALLIEDIDWLDPSTGDLVNRILPAMSRFGLPVLATMRTGAVPRWAESFDRMALDRLGPADVVALVAGLAAGRDLPAEVAQDIATRSDGVAIYAEELARGWLDMGTAALAEVPMSLSESLLWRLDRLLHGRRIAALTAAIGREIPVAVLAAVCDLPDAVVTESVAELLAAGIFVPGQSRFGAAIRFRHNLVREAAYELHLKRQRPALHARIADVLESQFPDIAAALPHVLASQRAAAGQDQAASLAWEAAGRDALQRSAYSEAASFLDSAIAANAASPEGPDRDRREFDLRTTLFGALICAEGYLGARAGKETARITDLSESLGETTGLIKALHARWVHIGSANDDQAARAFAIRARQLAQGGTTVDQLIAERMCATSALFCGALGDAMGHYLSFMNQYDPQAHGPAMRTGHSDHATMVMMGIAETSLLMGDLETAAVWRNRTLETAAASGRLHDRCHTLAFAGLCHNLLIREDDEARTYLAKLKALLTDHQVANWMGYLDLFEGALIGRAIPGQGIDIARRGFDALVADKAFGTWWLLIYAEVLLDAGITEGVAEVINMARAVATLGDQRIGAEFLRQEARWQAMRGTETGTVRALLEQALALAQQQGAGLLSELIRRDIGSS